MIQPNELRIGNNIFNGVIVAVNEDHFIFNDGYSNWSSKRFNSEVLAPIPITPEILERLGFVQNQTHKRYWHIEKFRYNTTKMLLDIDTGHRNGEGIGWMCVKIQYLHQLQNLFYALTNKELTFKTN